MEIISGHCSICTPFRAPTPTAPMAVRLATCARAALSAVQLRSAFARYRNSQAPAFNTRLAGITTVRPAVVRLSRRFFDMLLGFHFFRRSHTAAVKAMITTFSHTTTVRHSARILDVSITISLLHRKLRLFSTTKMSARRTVHVQLRHLPHLRRRSGDRQSVSDGTRLHLRRHHLWMLSTSR